MTDTTSSSSCPLCCNEFTTADRLYPIHCPTIQCHFQYCTQCIESLIQSSNDGYTEASDGSYQVKISIRCPMCRSPYRTPNHPVATSPTAVSNTIVSAILKLRQAASIHIPSSSSNQQQHPQMRMTNDSDLSASQLAQRNQFIMHHRINNHNSSTTIISELKDAITIVQQYYDSIDHKDCGTVPPLPWEDWEKYIQTLQQQEQQQQQLQLSNMALSSGPKKTTTSVSETAASSPEITTTISRDPTLFMGLDELLTYDEQEFITHMFISGDAELIAQAAHLLHSIMCTMMMQQQSSASSSASASKVDSNQARSTAPKPNTTNTNNKKKQKTTAQLDHEQKIRKKFPLPNHMPRVVTIPPYNPLLLNNSKQVPIKFVPIPPTTSSSKPQSRPPPPSNQNTKSAFTELTLASVNGMAGRVGLRRGDIITHVNQERVRTFSEYTIAVQYALEQQQQDAVPEPSKHGPLLSTMTITVNANDDIAQQLLVRAQQMQQQNVRFHC